MAKAELKTQPADTDILAYLNALPNEKDRADCLVLHEMMSKATGEEPVLWGGTMVGYGKYAYKYKTGREGEYFRMGFAPRKTALTLYFISYNDPTDPLFERLGKFKLGKGCLYIKRLADVNLSVLEELIQKNLEAKPMGVE